MEEIQFFNYLFSILAVVLSAYAFYSTNKAEERQEKEIKVLKERINFLADSVNNTKKR